MFKCPKCDNVSSRNAWNEATGERYEEFWPMEDKHLNIDASFVCPMCGEEVDGNVIIPTAHVSTVVEHVRESRTCECGGVMGTTQISVEHMVVDEHGYTNIVPIKVTVVFCNRCGYQNASSIID